jgi:hypothetical protein
VLKPPTDATSGLSKSSVFHGIVANAMTSYQPDIRGQPNFWWAQKVPTYRAIRKNLELPHDRPNFESVHGDHLADALFWTARPILTS